MASRFAQIGEGEFPGSRGKVKCGVYEWDPGDLKRHGRFRLQFLSPEGEPGPRVFYSGPVLGLWMEDRPTCFLERACKHGRRVLAELQPSVPEHPVVVPISEALFRNRDSGHHSINRLFQTAADFVTLGPGGTLGLVTPGIGEDILQPPDGAGGSVHRRAKRLLSEALRGVGVEKAGDRSRFPGVLAAYEALTQGARDLNRGQGGSCFVPFDELPGRSGLDLLFVDGLKRSTPWDGERAMANVRSALIFGPVSKADEALPVQDRALFKRFCAKLRTAAKTRPARDFDRWLADVRTHGYLSLVGGTPLKGENRERASLQATRMYCALTWMAYQWAARCYGALMLRVFLDFCLSDCRPSEEERWLFRQYHFPQLHLAGLPLDFFGKAQIRWVIRMLKLLWAGPVIEPDRYDFITDLLGVFGGLVRVRREEDRRSKAAPAGKRMTATDSSILSDVLVSKDDQWGKGIQPAARKLSSRDCPRCGEQLDLVKVLDPSRYLVRLRCGGCELEDDFEVEIGAMNR